MKTIKGLPVNVEIGKDVTLEETERLMLRVSESHNLSRSEEQMLLKSYKDARRRWLDERHELDGDHLKALHDADNKITTAAKQAIDIVCRTLESEAQLPEEERLLGGAYVHLEEEGLPMGIKDVHEMSDEEIDLGDLLFSEDQRGGGNRWGFPLGVISHVSIDFYKGWRKQCYDRLEKTGEHGLSPLFWAVRDRYNVALQDMARVAGFQLTVDYFLL